MMEGKRWFAVSAMLSSVISVSTPQFFPSPSWHVPGGFHSFFAHLLQEEPTSGAASSCLTHVQSSLPVAVALNYQALSHPSPVLQHPGVDFSFWGQIICASSKPPLSCLFFFFSPTVTWTLPTPCPEAPSGGDRDSAEIWSLSLCWSDLADRGVLCHPMSCTCGSQVVSLVHFHGKEMRSQVHAIFPHTLEIPHSLFTHFSLLLPQQEAKVMRNLNVDLSNWGCGALLQRQQGTHKH